MSFFVMLKTQSGGYTPMMGGEHGDELAVYEEEADAVAAAQQNILGRAFGATVYDTDADGESV